MGGGAGLGRDGTVGRAVHPPGGPGRAGRDENGGGGALERGGEPAGVGRRGETGDREFRVKWRTDDGGCGAPSTSIGARTADLRATGGGRGEGNEESCARGIGVKDVSGPSE